MSTSILDGDSKSFRNNAVSYYGFHTAKTLPIVDKTMCIMQLTFRCAIYEFGNISGHLWSGYSEGRGGCGEGDIMGRHWVTVVGREISLGEICGH